MVVPAAIVVLFCVLFLCRPLGDAAFDQDDHFLAATFVIHQRALETIFVDQSDQCERCYGPNLEKSVSHWYFAKRWIQHRAPQKHWPVDHAIPIEWLRLIVSANGPIPEWLLPIFETAAHMLWTCQSLSTTNRVYQSEVKMPNGISIQLVLCNDTIWLVRYLTWLTLNKYVKTIQSITLYPSQTTITFACLLFTTFAVSTTTAVVIGF